MPICAKNQILSFTPIRCQASPVYGANKQGVLGPAERFGVAAAPQREKPVDAGKRTHGMRHHADVRFGDQRWPERQLYEVQLTSGRAWASRCSDDYFLAARTSGTDPYA
jgi:hypothetical protein